MIVTAIQCENCDKTHQVARTSRPYEWNLPAAWITLFQGNPEGQEAQHFCSQACLAQWAGAVAPSPAPIEAPQSKTRRFVLINGETADETECVLWNNGRVTIEPPYDTGTYTFPSWDMFKASHPGDGVTWVDPEVSA